MKVLVEIGGVFDERSEYRTYIIEFKSVRVCESCPETFASDLAFGFGMTKRELERVLAAHCGEYHYPPYGKNVTIRRLDDLGVLEPEDVKQILQRLKENQPETF